MAGSMEMAMEDELQMCFLLSRTVVGDRRYLVNHPVALPLPAEDRRQYPRKVLKLCSVLYKDSHQLS